MRKLVILLFCSFSLIVSGQKATCGSFKTGEFKYVNANNDDWIIKRTLTEQIETNSKTGLIVHNTINWISDCKFTLTCTKVSMPQYNHAIGKVFTIKITKVSSKGYSCILMKNEVVANNLFLDLVRVNE